MGHASTLFKVAHYRRKNFRRVSARLPKGELDEIPTALLEYALGMAEPRSGVEQAPFASITLV
jgi:hypothetical protein